MFAVQKFESLVLKDPYHILFCLACEAAVTGLIDLFLLGVDVDTIENALEVNKKLNFNFVAEFSYESMH